MTCDSPGEDDVTEKGGSNKTGGIVSGHAYSLLKV